MSEEKVFTLDFVEKSVSRVAFTNSKEKADWLCENLGMHIYYPSELADLGLEEEFYVLFNA